MGQGQGTRVGRGRFITFEGIEGAGKSSQIDNARNLLLDAGLQVVTTREPGGSAIAERIRALLLDPCNAGLNQTAELLLMFAARSEHLQKTIVPALEVGTWVLCDRFTDATYAYQGGGRGLDRRRIGLLEDLVQGDLRPDLTLLFDLPVGVGLERAGRRSAPDRFESETWGFFEAVRGCYLERAKHEPERIRIIDAAQELTTVEAQVRGLLQQFVANDHGAHATAKNVVCGHHDRFPHPGPVPEGEGDQERARRDFHGKVRPVR